jgi:hypothetical protein
MHRAERPVRDRHVPQQVVHVVDDDLAAGPCRADQMLRALLHVALHDDDVGEPGALAAFLLRGARRVARRDDAERAVLQRDAEPDACVVAVRRECRRREAAAVVASAAEPFQIADAAILRGEPDRRLTPRQSP